MSRRESNTTDSSAALESLESLIGRLGIPPADITAAWCLQADSVAHQHEHDTGQGLPAFALSDWSVSHQGRLRWRTLDGETLDNNAPADNGPPTLSRPSLDHLAELHRCMSPLASPSAVAVDSSGTDFNHQQPTTKRPQAGQRSKQALFAAGLLACLAAVGFILRNASSPQPTVIAKHDSSNSTPSSIFSPGITASRLPSGSTRQVIPEQVISEQAVSNSDSGDLETLETIESMTGSDTSEVEIKPDTVIELESTFSLDDLMPPVANFLSPMPSGSNRADRETKDPKPADGGTDAASIHGESADAVMSKSEATDEDEPVESPQPTHASSVMAVELQGVAGDMPTQLGDIRLSDFKLEFPFDVPLNLRGQSPWTIQDTRGNVPVASITSGPDGTELTWDDHAEKSASVASLAHGRIKPAQGGTIFLRPTIEAVPWLIRLDKHDVMPSWNLRHPIAPRVARMSLELVLPEEIDLGWLEPIDPDSIRRTRGLVVLTPKDSETVSLGIRFDIRCGTKLSLRIRFAAKLDPSMPWQIVSNSMLQQLANQLTDQATLVSNESTRLTRVARMAGPTGRRVLRIKQDRNDGRGEMVKSTSLRVAQLQTMIAALEAEGSLRLQIWVQWPDMQQMLLTMEEEASSP